MKQAHTRQRMTKITDSRTLAELEQSPIIKLESQCECFNNSLPNSKFHTWNYLDIATLHVISVFQHFPAVSSILSLT